MLKKEITSFIQNLSPAMQALTRDTQVPVIMALSTTDETSPFLEGHMEALRRENTYVTDQ